MPTNKNASIRYQALDKCFRDYRHRYYIDDLIDRCEESLVYYNGVGGVIRRQIFEDINFMESDSGWSIPLKRKKDGKKVYYRYENPEFSINAQPLTDEEAQQLQTVILTLSRFRGLPCNEWVEEVISNLEWRFNLKGNCESIISFEQNPNLKGLNFLAPIIEATSNHQVLKIVYCNYKNVGNEKELILHPYYIKQYNSRWFLMALDNGNHYISNLALDRIHSVEVTDKVRFIPNSDIDFEHYFDDVIGVTIPPKEIIKEVIKLQLTANQYPYVITKPLHLTQQIVNEENRIITIEVRPNYELDQQILSLGPDVKVLAPDSYRGHIVHKIEESLKNYLSVQNDYTNDK
jgi:predicted DNA-binding transcriptional regulator YafY